MKAQTESRNTRTVKIFQEKQKPTSIARNMILPKVYMRKSKAAECSYSGAEYPRLDKLQVAIREPEYWCEMVASDSRGFACCVAREAFAV